MNTLPKISLAALILTSASAFANGTGYNGPDLNPVSIPVQLDRGISVAEVGEAISTCLATGSESQGLVSVIARAEHQVDPGSKVGASQCTGDYCTKPSFQNVDRVIKGVTQYSSQRSRNQWNSGEAYLQYCGSNCVDNYLLFSVFTVDTQQVQLHTENNKFPMVTFNKLVQDGGFDELGRHQDAKTIVSGLEIQVPADFAQNGAALPTYNVMTGQKTAVTLNAKEYVQCLVSQIQK